MREDEQISTSMYHLLPMKGDQLEKITFFFFKQWNRREYITAWMQAACKQEICIAVFTILHIWLMQKGQKKLHWETLVL